MNSIERVWKRMKEAAVKSAHRKTAITMRESEDTVRKLCRQEKATAPPQDALEFLAEELMRLTLEAQSASANLPAAEIPTARVRSKRSSNYLLISKRSPSPVMVKSL
jgi:hypothetical protein